MRHRARVQSVVAAAGLAAALVGCGGEDSKDGAEKSADSSTGSSEVELKGNSALDLAGYAVVQVQSQKYSDYEVDGQTVRLLVRDGVTLSGSECAIVTAATSADHPDANFVVVEPNGDETPC